jgi:hypothetical protein
MVSVFGPLVDGGVMGVDGGRRGQGRQLTPEEERVGRELGSRRAAALLLVGQVREEIGEWLVEVGDASRPALGRALGVTRKTVEKWIDERP